MQLLDERLLGLAKVRVSEPDPGHGPSDWSGEIDLDRDAEVAHEPPSALLDGTIHYLMGLVVICIPNKNRALLSSLAYGP